uniref:uncharacterized protein LOC112431243 isoform X2 n=1 Tax=Maylandia zebra TaxID=106582 RepID=UPI000D310DA2|nr:uncharacterized protein LOC112431243 isoform X2 [Maylandia zebra]
MADGEHFVDKHSVQLIQGVSNIAPILDELLDKEVIDQEQYDKIRALPTSQDRMRELYSGPLKAGAAYKDIFHQILLANEKFLVNELRAAGSSVGAAAVSFLSAAAGSSAEGFDVEETEKEKHSEDERWPALIHKVETMESVIELLLEALDGLNEPELHDFNWTLRQIHRKYYSDFSWMWYMRTNLQHTVFLMVQTYGQQSVEKTMEVLKEMKRTDLAQRLSDCSSLPRKKHSVDERRSALIHKMATMAAVKHLLLETLNDLSDEELKKFKRLLQTILPWRNLSFLSYIDRLSLSLTRADIMNLMVDELGHQSVEVTREVFMHMNRTDLVQKLPESSSASREKHSVDEHGAALLKREKEQEAVRQILLETLNEFSQKDLKKFKQLLPFTCFKMSLPQMERYWYPNRTEDLVNLMVDKLGHQSVEATMEVLTDMNRPDLMLRLSESSSGRKTERSSELEGCQSLTDCSDWTNLEPEVNSTDADEAPTYSLQSAAGHFECRVSGLRWVCKGKTSFQYQFRSWEGHMERMESRQYMPAGPLMDVTVTAGKLNEVHLPHWICIAAGSSVGAAAVSSQSAGKHFVDKHRVQLIQRVSNIAPILDELLDNEVINQETYTRIRALSTTQEKMRELYSGPLKASAACKDIYEIFYDILLANEKFLVKELSEKD